jgi:putative MFS transporter
MGHSTQPPKGKASLGDGVAKKEEISIDEVIEEIGFGRAQFLTFVTGGAVLFNRGVQMCLMSILTIPIARDFNLNSNQQGLLSTAIFLGMLIGTMASGHVGDRVGRKMPIVTSSIAVAAIGCLSAAMPTYNFLLLFRFLLGIAMAFGDVPVTAMFSEVSPRRWKIPMRAATEAIFDVGYTYSALLASTTDPFLRELNWRRIMILTCIPPGAVALVSVLVLQESPVYLASRGLHGQAARVLESFRRMNGRPSARIDYGSQQLKRKDLANDEEGMEEPQATNQYRVIFGSLYWRTTVVLAVVGFGLNMFYYGGMYAQPQVMTKGKGLAPGWEIVIGGIFDVVGICVATVLATFFPRRVVLSFACVMASVCFTCFGFAGSVNNRNGGLEVMYQFGVAGFYWVPAAAFIVFGQLAVECFPTSAAATGGSVIFTTGRFGAMVAPMIFENMRASLSRWEIFCYLTAVLTFLGLPLLIWDAMTADPTRNDPVEKVPDRKLPLAAAEEGKAA